jgi:hypothetical protein
LKGNWSLRRRQRLPLRNSSFAATPRLSPSLGREFKAKGLRSKGRKHEHQAKGLHLWYKLHSFVLTKEGECNFEGSNDSVFGDLCQKGGEMSPKQKDRTTTNFKNLVLNIFQLVSYYVQKGEKVNIFQLVSYYVQKGEKVVFQNDISKPSWTLRGGFHLGGVLFSQRKAFKTGEESLTSWKCFAKSYSFTFDYLQMNFKNGLQKSLQKQNMWCKRGPKCYIRKKQSMHIL